MRLKPGVMQVGEALAVDIFFDAGDAVIVGIGEAEHMGAERAVGIDALVFRHEADAGQAETEDRLLLFRRHVALDPDEAFARAEFFAQFAGVDVGQYGGDSSVASSLSMMWRGSANTDITLMSCRQHLAIAIDQIRAARRRPPRTLRADRNADPA